MATDIITQIEQAAGLYPENLALETFGPEKEIRYTYRQALELAKILGQSLSARGVSKGDRVAFWAGLSPNWVVAYWGALRIGAVVVPLDIEYGARDLSSILARIECKVIFSAEEKLPLLYQTLAGIQGAPAIITLDPDCPDREYKYNGCLSVESLFERNGDAASFEQTDKPHRIDPEDAAMIFFTSGATGEPKGVVIPHRSAFHSVTSVSQCVRVTAKDKVLAVAPSHHVFAALTNILAPLANGSGVTYLRSPSGAELLGAMAKVKMTTFPGAPQVFQLLHKKIFDEAQSKPFLVRVIFRLLLRFCYWTRRKAGLNPGLVLFSKVHQEFGGCLRLLLSATSNIDPKVVRDLYSIGFTVQQGYSLTETFGGGALTPSDDNFLGSAGKPTPGLGLKIVDQDESGVGEIALSGPSLMQGYLDDPESTAEVLRDGWFYTGDLAEQDENGHLYIRGRRKDMIVLSSGEKVYPEEVERHYLQIPHIKEICVTGFPGEGADAQSERLHAVIVPDFGYLKSQRIVNSKQIIREGIEQFSASLPKYKRILSYEFRTEPLPRTASRKIRRFIVVKELNAGREQIVSVYRRVEGDESLLAASCSAGVLETLKRESRIDSEIHLDMNLELDLGFDSLQRIELLAQIEQLLNISLGDDVASQTFTVRDLLKTVSQKWSESDGEVSKAAASPVKWKEIIASANPDESVERYVIEPTAFARATHCLALKLGFLIARIVFRLKVSGLEMLPKDRPFIICPNHQSYLDGALVAAVLPCRVIWRLVMLGFTPFFSGGFKSKIARALRIVPTDADMQAGRAMRVSAAGLKAKQNFIIFPEGSLSCDGELQVFKKGAAILARELRIPIVPVAIRGSFEAWSKVGNGIRFTPISITFGPPLEPEELETPTEERDQEYVCITQRIREAISRLITSHT